MQVGLLQQLRDKQIAGEAGGTPRQGVGLRRLSAIPNQQRCGGERERHEARLVHQRQEEDSLA